MMKILVGSFQCESNTFSDAKAGKDISIAVRISPQPTVGVPSEHTMGTTGGPCGGVARLDGPTFGCCVGWD